MKTKWIKGYEGLYTITDTGIIKNAITGLRLRPYCANKDNPLLRVKLYKDGTKKNLYVHKLVAANFMKRPKNCSKVTHLNSNEYNNHTDNLKWI